MKATIKRPLNAGLDPDAGSVASLLVSHLDGAVAIKVPAVSVIASKSDMLKKAAWMSKQLEAGL
jgi:hypothetical protein